MRVPSKTKFKHIIRVRRDKHLRYKADANDYVSNKHPKTTRTKKFAKEVKEELLFKETMKKRKSMNLDAQYKVQDGTVSQDVYIGEEITKV